MKLRVVLSILLPATMVVFIAGSWVLHFTGFEVEMAGVSEDVKNPQLTLTGVLDGSYQTELDNYINDIFSVKDIGIKTKNTIDAMVFGITANDSLQIGYNNNLFERQYLDNYMVVSEDLSGAYSYDTIKSTLDDLKYIFQELNKAGKDAVVYITPSKAYFYPEDIPLSYNLLALTTHEKQTYSVLLSLLDEFGLSYYDTYQYYVNNDIGMSVFPTTGTHWSTSAAYFSLQDFTKQFNDTSLNTLPSIIATEPLPVVEQSEIISTDVDIYNLMNTFRSITDPFFLDEQYYYNDNYHLEYDTGLGRVSISVQGGSFVEPFQHALMYSDYVDEMQILSNNIFVDKHDGVTYLDSYSEVDFDKFLQSDVIIFEVNQQASSRMGFGFIEQLRSYIETKGVPYSQSDEVGSTMETAVFEHGIYDDNWLAPSARVDIKSGSNGIVLLSGYYPGPLPNDELTIDVSVNGETHRYNILSESFTFEIPVEAQTAQTIQITSNFIFDPNSADERELAFQLVDIKGN